MAMVSLYVSVDMFAYLRPPSISSPCLDVMAGSPVLSAVSVSESPHLQHGEQAAQECHVTTSP